MFVGLTLYRQKWLHLPFQWLFVEAKPVHWFGRNVYHTLGIYKLRECIK